jgi:hypothetical protein
MLKLYKHISEGSEIMNQGWRFGFRGDLRIPYVLDSVMMLDSMVTAPTNRVHIWRIRFISLGLQNLMTDEIWFS